MLGPYKNDRDVDITRTVVASWVWQLNHRVDGSRPLRTLSLWGLSEAIWGPGGALRSFSQPWTMPCVAAQRQKVQTWDPIYCDLHYGDSKKGALNFGSPHIVALLRLRCAGSV